MKWDTISTFHFLLIGIVISFSQCMETQDSHAPSVDKTYHFPSASLTIAGDLKDVKLKGGTIAQLVRALQQPNQTKPAEVPEQSKPKTAKKKIIHPSQLITKHTLQKQHSPDGKSGKKLYYGDALPETITVSSQSVKVTQVNASGSSSSSSTGAKRARHLSAYIGNNPSAVRTVEGVRVPDDEHDKHYTWRNARVIKGFLVPNDRPANPHKKRQVIITDPQQYLAAAAAAQAQGATTIIDTSGLQQRSSGNSNNNNGQQRASVFYAQEPALQGGGLSQNERSHHNHPHVNYPNQHQQQHHHAAANNGQTSTFSYAHQNPHNMYVVQDGNNGFTNSNPKYGNNQATQQSLHQHQHHHQAQLAQQQAQAQFFSRSGEAPIAPVSSSSINSAATAAANNPQRGSENSAAHQAQQQQQSLSAAIKQQQYQSNLDTQAIQAAVEAVQQLEAQQQAASVQQQQTLSISGLSIDPQQHQHQQQQGVPAIQQATQQQLAALFAQQSAPAQSLVLPQGIAGATAQEILAATQAAAANDQVTAQFIQLQPSQEQPLLQQLQQQQAQASQQQQLQFPAPDQFSERQQFPGGAAFPASSAQFVIQPQTYIAGAGGQTFTVPIPVPVEQAVAQATQQQQHQARLHPQQQQQFANPQQQQHQQQLHQFQQQQQQQNHHQYQQQQPYISGPSNNGNNRQYQPGQNPNQASISDKMKQVFNQNFNRKMLERVETNAVVPALASTGLFLGLSALAAGWYLSKSNREVGIVRRTGKFSKKKGAPILTVTQGGDIAPPEIKDEGTANTRTRRDLASMVTPHGYTPNGAPEVDQATFFQSIIQQSLEKTQKEYDDTPEQSQYNQDPNGSHNQYDQQGPVGYHRGEVEPDRHAPPPPPPPPPSRFRSKHNRYNERPTKFFRDDDYYDPANSRISKSQGIQEKSGGWSVTSAKNFARVAIPAVVLTGAALGICAVIFGWYISGDNREIAFLESPTTNSIGQQGWSRRKRSLFSSNAPAWSDGWLIRTLKAIHGNPYDNQPAPTAKSFVPYPYFLDKDSSKTSTMEFKVSNNGLASVIAGGAVLAVVALGLINSFAESSGRNLKTARYNHLLTSGSGAALTKSSSNSNNPLTHLRSPRNYFENNLEFHELSSKPSFFEQIVASAEGTGHGILSKLQEMSASSTWQKSSCIKSLLCRSISNQGDDTVGLMEKRMATVMKMLPESISSSINNNFSDVLAAIYRRDCSTFSCSAPVATTTTEEKAKVIPAPSVSSVPISIVSQKRIRPGKRASSHKKTAKTSIKVQQTVTKSKTR